MAVGFSGSGGGITYPLKEVGNYESFVKNVRQEFNLKYVDYFINNKCNLCCKHCYVAYKKSNNDLTIDEWQKAFDYCIDLGVKVFGNVGKEPLLTWHKTKSILSYFKKKKEKDTNIKFGIVTNGLLIDNEKARELKALNIDYVDVSIDGTESAHDNIRGKGTYARIIQNILLLIKLDLSEKIFVSYTLNKLNQDSFPSLINELYSLGIKNYLISPYLTKLQSDALELTTNEYVNFVKNLLYGQSVNFSSYENIVLYVRNDFTSLKYQTKLLEQSIIDNKKLLIDSNDGVYYIYKLGKNEIIFNVQTWIPDFWHAFRISHDGYVSNCFDMFFPEYPKRAIGNVRMDSLKKLLCDDTPQAVVANL